MNLLRTLPLYLFQSSVLLAVFSAIFANPFTNFGVWSDAEPVVLAFFLAGALAWLGHTLHFFTPNSDKTNICAHPFVYIHLLIAIWSIIGLFNSEYPYASLFGPLQTGEGIFWYVTSAGVIGAALRLKEHPRFWDKLPLFLCASLTIQSIVALNNIVFLHEVKWLINIVAPIRFYAFNDHLAFSAGALLVLAYLEFQKQKHKTSLLCVVCASAGLLVSENLTAILLVCALTLILGLTALIKAKQIFSTEKALIPTFVLVSLIAPILIYLVIAQTSLVDQVYSLWARQALFKIYTLDLAPTQLHTLFGHGWGQYAEILARNLTRLGISILDGSWEEVYRDEFHSHHILLETYYAAGLGGVLLVLSLYAAIILKCDKDKFVPAIFLSLFISILGSLWFMLPTNMAFISVALAGISAPLSPKTDQKWVGRSTSVIISGLSAISLLFCILFLFNYAHQMKQVEECLLGESTACPTPIPHDPRGLEQGGSYLLKAYTRSLFESAEVTKENWPERTKQFLMLKDELRKHQPEQSILRIIALQDYYANVLHNPRLKSVVEDQIAQEALLWEELNYIILSHYPARIDLIYLYSDWLISHANTVKLTQLEKELTRALPNHPVSLWIQGQSKILSDSSEAQIEGIGLLQDALLNRLENYIEVDQDLKKQLLKP